MSVHNQLGLKGGKISDDQVGVRGTHIEENNDPAELGLPSGNRLLIVPRMKNSRGCVSPALVDDLVLDFCDSPVIESMVGRGTRDYNIVSTTHIVS